ncbi:hypothetical protein PENSUB_9430 [Penicillium subrubescens]|jgi:blocked-early-in-transport protein 1|uniref:Protein transport protein sft1 n=1 Tax=Penicillium subrubescens TaxID=1316194 RepID=A0A1Q5TDN2_9EURO|nr:hypothetical protein PENSUB_9430 [Penicillium subrubescens]
MRGIKILSIIRYVSTAEDMSQSWRLRRSFQIVDLGLNTADIDFFAQNEVFSSFSTNLKGSASRLTRMAKQGDTVAVLKVAGIFIGAGLLIYIILGWIF